MSLATPEQPAEQLRALQLAALDVFASAAMEVHVALTQRLEKLGAPAEGVDRLEWLEAMQQAADRARDHANDLTRAFPRIEVLFGHKSTVSQWRGTVLKSQLELTFELLHAERDNFQRVETLS